MFQVLHIIASHDPTINTPPALLIMCVGRNTVSPCAWRGKTTDADLYVTKMPSITGTTTKPMTHHWTSSYHIYRLVLLSVVAAFV